MTHIRTSDSMIILFSTIESIDPYQIDRRRAARTAWSRAPPASERRVRPKNMHPRYAYWDRSTSRFARPSHYERANVCRIRGV